MIFSLDVRRARKGDCLLLHFGTKKDPGLVMIDGGPKAVYAPHLKPRLLEIRKARNLAGHEPLLVDVLMVSHVDDDHIQGILDLTRELRETAGVPMLQVASFWHNSFDNLLGHKPVELTAALSNGFGAASVAKESFAEDAELDVGDDVDRETVVDTLKVLASIEQGYRLRGDAAALGFPLNPEFGGELVRASNTKHEVASGLTFTVAGPMQQELENLYKDHQKWLEEQIKKGKPVTSALAAYVDESVPNLSSIVALARFGGKRVLLTGDARGDKILEGLEKISEIAAGGTIHVDLLKVPHHGSSNNLEKNFFQRITADHYVFSGNGEHGNPERESLEMLMDARGKAGYTIHLTYPVAEIDKGREADWNKERTKEINRAAKGSKKTPREAWSQSKHSLEELLKQRPLGPGQKISIVDATKPHVIDLLEPLGY